MLDRLKLTSMRGKAVWVSLMMLCASFFLTKASLEILTAFRASNTIQVLNVNIQKQLMMNRILSSLGYGGAIHAFKDYELRRRDKFYTHSLEGLAKSESLIHSYMKLGQVSEEERLSLAKLLKLIGFIKNSLLPIKQMLSDRVKSQDIDKELAIEYPPYRAAIDTILDTLEAEKNESLQRLAEQNPELKRKVTPIFQYVMKINTVSQHMGYAGVIHLYKNYILHGKISERQLYDSQLRTVSDVLEALKASDLNVNEETDALFESLSQLPLKYAKAMTKITTLREKGASLHRLVFKGRVKQDKTYIQALNQLNQLVSSKFTEEQVYSQRYLDQLVKSSQENFIMALVAIFICILLAIFVFAIQMPRLLAKSVHAVRHMTDKDALEIQELANRNDEFGALAKGIEYSANKMIEEEVMRQQQSVKEKICVEEEQKKARANHLEKLANDFEKSLGVIISDVSSYVEQAHQQAKLVNTMSNQLMEKSGHANDSSQEGIIFVELTERLSEEIRKSALGISEECKGASHLAVETRADTQKINQMISRLTEVSDRIDSVVRNISGIARNTRLLSMNATIEGASAGEAGKGFAVVANEVKGLASESAAAVEHIREEIGFMKQEIEATAKVLGETVENIGAVHQSVQTVSDSVNSQVQDIESVANNAGQASQSMQSIVKVIHHLSGAAEESEGASTELYGLINQVDEKMKEAKGNMQVFLQAIR